VKKGLLIVISGASGTGKGTVCKELLARESGIAYSVSATSRAPRAGEEEGREYYFRTREEFEQMIADGAFLEYADVYGNYYGTPLAPIEKRRAAGEDILLEIDTQGALNVMERCPDGTFIFLLPPSLEELHRRIMGRGTESEESLALRLPAAGGGGGGRGAGGGRRTRGDGGFHPPDQCEGGEDPARCARRDA